MAGADARWEGRGEQGGRLADEVVFHLMEKISRLEQQVANQSLAMGPEVPQRLKMEKVLAQYEDLPLRFRHLWESSPVQKQREWLPTLGRGGGPPMKTWSLQDQEVMRKALAKGRPVTLWASPGLPGLRSIARHILEDRLVFPGRSQDESIAGASKRMRHFSARHFGQDSHFAPLAASDGYGADQSLGTHKSVKSRADTLRSYWPKEFRSALMEAAGAVEWDLRVLQLLSTVEGEEATAAETWASQSAGTQDNAMTAKVKKGVRQLAWVRSETATVIAARVQEHNELWFAEALRILWIAITREPSPLVQWGSSPPTVEEVCSLFRGPKGRILGVPQVRSRVQTWIKSVTQNLEEMGRLLNQGREVVVQPMPNWSTCFWWPKGVAKGPTKEPARQATGASYDGQFFRGGGGRGGATGAAGARVARGRGRARGASAPSRR